MSSEHPRQVAANMTITLDGRITGPGGDGDMGWVIPHVLSDAVRDNLDRAVATATTAVMGSVNAEGFASVWPGVAEDDAADPRDRAFARWLTATDEVVLSSRGTSSWADARVLDEDAVGVVRRLRGETGGDILVLNSVSVIMPLLAADLVDRFDLIVVPEILGAGRVLFETPLPPSSWSLEHVATAPSGALATRYVRTR